MFKNLLISHTQPQMLFSDKIFCFQNTDIPSNSSSSLNNASLNRAFSHGPPKDNFELSNLTNESTADSNKQKDVFNASSEVI